MNAPLNLARLGLTAEQRAARTGGLGGSDANTILSGNNDRILRLWREKRGEIEPEDLSDNLAVQMGSFTEPLNVAWYEKQTGNTVTRCGESVQHPSVPFMRCTLDGVVVDPLGGELVFEAKHCGVRNTDAELFARYVPQLQHNALCAGLPGAVLSCFKGNGDFMFMEYETDAAYARALVEAEEAFWEHVRNGTPPVPLPLPPAPKAKGVKEVDMSASNSWCSYAADLLETLLPAQRHDLAKKAIKELVEPDVTRAFGAGVEFRRDKRGALRLHIGHAA